MTGNLLCGAAKALITPDEKITLLEDEQWTK
jgi:hypothetical protein